MKVITSTYKDLQVICACGHTLQTKSTLNITVLKLEVCAKCHPAFSDNDQIIDIEGKVDRFNRKFGDLSQI